MNTNFSTNFQFSFSNLSDVLYDALRQYSNRLIDSTTLFYEVFNILEEGNFDKDMFVKLQKYHRSLELVMSYYDKEPIFNISSENLQRDKNSKYYSWNDLFFSKKAFKVLALSQYLVFLDKRTEITAKDVWKALIITQCGGWMDYLTLNENDYHVTRIHEIGHALISYLLKNFTIFFVCSIPTENRNGYTLTKYEAPDRNNVTKNDFFNIIMKLAGGFAALKVTGTIPENYTGAETDRIEAYQYAIIIAIEYDGLTDKYAIKEKATDYVNTALEFDIELLKHFIDFIYVGEKVLEMNNGVCEGSNLTEIFDQLF